MAAGGVRTQWIARPLEWVRARVPLGGRLGTRRNGGHASIVILLAGAQSSPTGPGVEVFRGKGLGIDVGGSGFRN